MKVASAPPAIVVSPPVATSTTKIPDRQLRSGSRRRFAAKAIRVPSGDHAGPDSADGPLTSARAVPEATSTSHRWLSRSSTNPAPLYW